MSDKKYFIGKRMAIPAKGPICLTDSSEEALLFSVVDDLSVLGIVVDSFFIGGDPMLEIVDPIFSAIIWNDDCAGRIEVPLRGTSAIVAWSGQMTPKIYYCDFPIAEDSQLASRPGIMAH